MSNDVIDAIERSTAKAKEIVEFSAALERLKNNRDFKTVVLKGYFEDEAVRLVHLKSDQYMQAPHFQQSIVGQIDAIGRLSEFFSAVLHKASMATRQIEADQEHLQDLAAEELTND